MSANKNLFDLLGNDVEDETAGTPLLTKEIVKKTASTKKADVPPPSANKARASNKRQQPTGNEGAIRDKSAGRENNRSRPVVEGKPRSGPTRLDRHSATGKTDSEKKIKKGWGSTEEELSDEANAVEDALAEAEAEGEAPEQLKTLAEYLAELKLKREGLNTNKPVEKSVVDTSNDKVIEKKAEAFIAPEKVKTTKTKPKKEKILVEFEARYESSEPKPRFDRDSRGSRGGRGGPRGGSRGGSRGGARGGARGGKPAAPREPKVVKPSADDFPAL